MVGFDGKVKAGLGNEEWERLEATEGDRRYVSLNCGSWGVYGDPCSGRDWVPSSSEESEADRASKTLGVESLRKVLPGGVVWYLRGFWREGRERGGLLLSSMLGKPNSIASSNFWGER